MITVEIRPALALSLWLLVVLSSFVHAQIHRGIIRGRVLDPSNAVIPNATVRVTREGTNETRTATSTANGEYTFAQLQPGAYRIEAEANGFRKYSLLIELRVNQELRHDVSMLVAAMSGPHTVIVATLLKKDSAAQGNIIENQQVTGLPLDERNFQELALLVPGAAPAAQGSAGSVRGDFSFNVNGTREDSTNFLLDGVYNIDPKLNTAAVRPPVDEAFSRPRHC